jgi:hypothetical protein
MGRALSSSWQGKFAVFVQPNCYAKLLCRRQFNASAMIASTVLAGRASDRFKEWTHVANIFQKNLIREG